MLKKLQQNSRPLHDKSLGYSRDTKNISKYNKGKIQQANNQLNGEKFRVIPLILGTLHACPFSLYRFNIVLDILARAIRQQKENKGIQFGSNPKNSTRKLLQLINTTSDLKGYQINSK